MRHDPATSSSWTAAPDPNAVKLRRVDSNERFVAFAFAGADLLVETAADGAITYAAGAFRSRFGQAPESFVGRSVKELVAVVDHDTLEGALAFLAERGRMLPRLVRLADADRTRLALAGMALGAAGRPLRLCLSFARPPDPLTGTQPIGSAHSLARASAARMRVGTACDVGLLDIAGDGGNGSVSGQAIGRALETLAPDSVASELAPGRFGLLSPAGSAADLLSVANLLEVALRTQGMTVAVAARHLPVVADGMTQVQAARALRQALNVFARDGVAGLDSEGFHGGLAGYMERAGAQAASLRRAIRENQFDLAYQPIVNLSDRAIHHHEALLRPRRGRSGAGIAPQEFVMLVETSGIADELDLAVARLACDAAAAAGQAVAFNLSGQSVESAAFRERLLELLETHPARRAGLVLVEMTETAELVDMAEATRTAEAFRAMDVPFCLDDFGAGAQDIRAFRALNPSVVKLDGSYVPGITQEGRERALVVGMIEIARSGGASIVAERVETDAEAATLAALGVQHGQGWLFGRPGPLPRKPVPTSARGAYAARRKGEKESWG